MNNPRITSLFIFIFLVPAASRADVHYSTATKRNIRKGALIGAAAGLFEVAFFNYLDGARTLKDYKKYPIAYGICGGLGALFGYWITNFMSPESSFEAAQSEIIKIADCRHLQILNANAHAHNVIPILKNLGSTEMLPLYAAFTIYSNYIKRLERSRKWLEEVIKSDAQHLHEASYALLKELDEVESKIQNVLLIIKENENFLKEWTQAAQIAAQQQQTVVYTYYV